MIYLGDKKVGSGLPSDYDKLLNNAIYRGLEQPIVSEDFKLDADTLGGQASNYYAVAEETLTKATYESDNKLSTVEHWTGWRDVDGNKIYSKTFIGTAAFGRTEIKHGIVNIKNINVDSSISTAIASNNGFHFNVPMYISSTQSISVFIRKGESVFTLDIGPTTIPMQYSITLNYTCTDR